MDDQVQPATVVGRSGKPRILRWNGILGDANTTLRRMTFAIIVIATIAETFTQLGFVGVGLPGSYIAYAVALLGPVALVAMLFGPLAGTFEGLLAGSLLLLHSKVQPLDYYELLFVTPVSSVFLFTLCGFMLGFLFALALRNRPVGKRRASRIILICLVVSVFFTLGFTVNLMAQLVTEIVVKTQELAEVDPDELGGIVARFGRGDLQVLIDAAAMSMLCLLFDYIVRRFLASSGPYGIRTTFRAWLLSGVAATFMLTSTVSFVMTTAHERNTAVSNMQSEAAYLCTQIGLREEELGGLEALSEDASEIADLDSPKVTTIVDGLGDKGLLSGYAVDVDGTVLVIVGETILVSDDPNITPGDTLNVWFSENVREAIDQALATGEPQQTFIESTDTRILDVWFEDEWITTQIAYLVAQSVDHGAVVIMMPANMVFADRGDTMIQTTFTTLALLLVVYGLASHLLGRLVMRRVDEINGVLGQITAGDLDARVDIHDSREFESLAGGVNTTVDTLKGWIAEAETRMAQEMSTAKQIQASALPSVFPPYPDILRFDVYASMDPAREVGGDFYDFFLVGEGCNLDEGKLAFIIADVSGKGVPAALFMMTAKTLIHGYVEVGGDLGEAIENVNHRLCEGNERNVFVTAFIGVLDYATGHVDFVNAGHNPPLLWREKKWQWVTEKSGIPLGLFDGLPYVTHSIDLKPGDQFLLYTDGVTEAMSVDNKLYGEERLMDLASEYRHLHPRELIERVAEDVDTHAAGAPQSDDITMLSVEYGVAPEFTHTLIVPANVEELERVREFVHSELDRRLCPVRAQNQLDIALEELFVNVCHYAYPQATPDNPGNVRILCSYSAEPPSCTVVIVDDGIPFDPLKKPDATTPEDIADVAIGGLGILMAKRSVDEISYERVDNSNMVTIVKKW